MDWTPLRDIPGPALVVLCGAAGSGKSTLATAAWPGEVVSSDALRELTGAGQAAVASVDLVHRITAMRLRRGLRTVVDATNTAQWHRGPLLALAAEHAVPAYAVVCWPPLETCLERNEGRSAGRVPQDVVRRQYGQLTAQMPSQAEGFARVIITGGESWLGQAAERAR
jgi:predicted kinase